MCPRSTGYILVTSTFKGDGFVSPNDRLYHKHQEQVASGPMTCVANAAWRVEILNTSKHPRRLPKGTKVGTLRHFEGSVTAVTTEQLDALAEYSQPKASSDSTKCKMPHGHRENVPPELHSKLEGLLEKHHKLWDGDLGLIKATSHRLTLKPGAKPVRLNPYRLGPRSRGLIKTEVDRMLDRGVIEPSKSEWASPVVLVPKPDGSVRFCIDYRKLNELTVKDSYPLPRMDHCLDSLGDASFFSTLDCNAGYWQIPVSPEDRHLTTFTCHCGLYQCTRLPFGLCNAPVTFQRAID